MNRYNLLFAVLALLFFAVGIYYTFKPEPALTKPGLAYYPAVNELAPEILSINPQNEEIRLSALKGNFVLVDFWASWCEPCRKINPELVLLYHNFRNKEFKDAQGFEIFSFSLDTKKNKWLEAIKKDGLDWPSHASDLEGWNSRTVATYQITAIPTNLILDPDGLIIAIDVSISEIKEILQSHIK